MDQEVLGRFGIWTSSLGDQPPAVIREVAAEVEGLGFGASWVPEAMWADPFLIAAHALAATSALIVATGYANIHARTPRTMINASDALGGWHPGRFVLGLGVTPSRWSRRGTAATTRDHSQPWPPTSTGWMPSRPAGKRPVRLVAALGPKMTELGGARSGGVHTYNVPVQHTASSRQILGPGPLLAPELKVVMEKSDPAVARRIARGGR